MKWSENLYKDSGENEYRLVMYFGPWTRGKLWKYWYSGGKKNILVELWPKTYLKESWKIVSR